MEEQIELIKFEDRCPQVLFSIDINRNFKANCFEKKFY